MAKLLALSNGLSQYLNDYDGYRTSTDKLLSNLFDGFIFYLAIVVFIVTILILAIKYRKSPTVGKKRALTTITILLTIFDSLLLLFKVDLWGLLFNPYDYFTGYNFSAFTPGTSEYAIYLSYFIVLIATIVAGIIMCVVGYSTVADKELSQKAYAKAQTLQQQYKNNNPVPRPAEPQPQYSTWQCTVCGTVNKDMGGGFCAQCGAKKAVLNNDAPVNTPENK